MIPERELMTSLCSCFPHPQGITAVELSGQLPWHCRWIPCNVEAIIYMLAWRVSWNKSRGQAARARWASVPAGRYRALQERPSAFRRQAERMSSGRPSHCTHAPHAELQIS